MEGRRAETSHGEGRVSFEHLLEHSHRVSRVERRAEPAVEEGEHLLGGWTGRGSGGTESGGSVFEKEVCREGGGEGGI